MVTGLMKVDLPAEMTAGLLQGQSGPLLNEIKNPAPGSIVSAEAAPEVRGAAENYARLRGLEKKRRSGRARMLFLGRILSAPEP